MKVNPEHAPNPRECLLHGWYSEQYGAEPFAIDLWEVQLFLRVSRPTASTMPARMLELGLLRRLEDGRYLVAYPVPQDLPAPQEAAPASKPKPAPKPKDDKQTDPLFPTYIEMWHQHLLKHTGIGFKPSNGKAEGLAMNSILAKARAIAKNTEGSTDADVNVIAVWAKLLERMPSLHDYLRPMKLTQVNERFESIVDAIKNGTQKAGGDKSRKPTAEEVAAKLFDKYGTATS